MADIVDVATRSRMMRGIRSKNTKPEILVRSLLHQAGFRFRLHVRSLPGRPDIVLSRYRAVVQVNGCFWHGHNCPMFRMPSSRTDFWTKKIDRNRSNDFRAIANLNQRGWRVATVWECALKGRRRLSNAIVIGRLARWIYGRSDSLNLAGKKPRNE
jgi:DNA mismatch endonuclease, patch repair protein